VSPRLPLLGLGLATLLVLIPAAGGTARASGAVCAPFDATKLEGPSLTVAAFGTLLGERIDACATEARKDDGAAFWRAHGLETTPARQRDHARVRTLFELTRDGGPWRVRWAITNEEPTAKKIWSAWRARPPASFSAAASVTAECDEISALFAGLATRLGVRGVGLFWPTSNHTIAAWEAAPGVRILVPTTQIFAACDDTFDRAPFSPKVQKTVFELSARDIPDATPVPRALALFLLQQVDAYAGASLDVLEAIRLHRALALGSSVASTCTATVGSRASQLRQRTLSPADRGALLHYARERGLDAAAAARDPASALDFSGGD